MLTQQRFREWLEAYGRAWETGDPDAAAALFAADAVYEETPFDQPMHGREEVRAYWSAVPREQRDIRFRFEILACEGDSGVAHWRTSLTRVTTGGRVELDGILWARFDAEGRCRHFREWWHRKEQDAAGGSQA